jgi:DNA-binding IclR family transcriptional regulator
MERDSRSHQQSQSRRPALEEALGILIALGEGNPSRGASLATLGRRFLTSKARLLRVLGTLSEMDFVEKSPESDRYRLGPRVLELGVGLLASLELRQEALPVLHQLSQLTGEVAQLGVMDRGRVICIEKVETGSGPVRVYQRLGAILPVHTSALGKAMLSQLPEEEISRELGEILGSSAELSSRYQQPLLSELYQCRTQGFAVDDQQTEAGVSAIGAAILDFRGQVIGALGVAGPATRLDAERLGEFCVAVKSSAEQVSRRMGYQPTRLLTASLKPDLLSGESSTLRDEPGRWGVDSSSCRNGSS